MHSRDRMQNCQAEERPELLGDERFSDVKRRSANAGALAGLPMKRSRASHSQKKEA